MGDKSNVEMGDISPILSAEESDEFSQIIHSDDLLSVETPRIYPDINAV